MINFDTHLDLIFSLMEKHSDQRQKQSELMSFYYDLFDPKTRKAVDIILANICGYSMDTILYHPEKILQEAKCSS